MSNTAKSIQISNDEHDMERAEMIDGVTVYKALPGGRHSAIAFDLSHEVAKFFKRRSRDDGTGGWWVMEEVSIQYRNISEKGRILIADIAGWRRSRVPVRPSEYPVQDKPDWVCEVCHSTRKKDTLIVPETLAAEGVEWYWLVDVEEELLTIFHLENGHFSLLKTYSKDSGSVRLPPFDAVELSIPVFFGEDSE